MGNHRFGWREVKTRKPHPCHWCPDEIPAGAVVGSWSCPSPSGLIRGWAHDYCDSESMAMIADAMGADAVPAEPDRGCIPRMMGFFEDREEFIRAALLGIDLSEVGRLLLMWERVHHGDLGEMAGVGR